jgi:alpha-beta hydrolase superfamily lysophospholipase
MKGKKYFRRIGWLLTIIFLLMNVVAFFHAYKFTHFSENDVVKSTAKNLSFFEKLKTLTFGISNPRPINRSVPKTAYETINIQSNKRIECWLINADNSRGTIIMFHGYGGEKASMLDKADRFLQAGYSTLLVDFMGAGGSEGNQTTIGYKEAQQVKSCFDYMTARGEKRIYLFGTSLGAVAILKAIHDYQIMPDGIVIECPFGSLYQTVCARFKSLNVPSFPMAALLVFWGGIQNGFWGFSFKPDTYANSVTCPALIFYGEKDEKVSMDEIEAIYSNLKGNKRLLTFPLAGHENYLIKYDTEWTKEMKNFLSDNGNVK